MDADGSIRTQFDDLVAGIRRAGGKPLSVSALSSATGLSAVDIMKWLSILEKHGQVHVQNRFSGVYVHWKGEPEKNPHASHGTDPAYSSAGQHQSEIEIARQREEEGKQRRAAEQPSGAEKEEAEREYEETFGAQEDEALAMQRHKEVLESAGADLVDVSEKIESIGNLISELKKQKSTRKKTVHGEKGAKNGNGITLITDRTPDAASSSLEDLTHEGGNAGASLPPHEVFGEPDTEEPLGEVSREDGEAGIPAPGQEDGNQNRDGTQLSESTVQKQEEPQAKERKKIAPKILPLKRAHIGEKTDVEEAAHEEETKVSAPELISPESMELALIADEQPSGMQIKPILPKRKIRIQKITRMEPVQPTSVSLQFSEKMARHIRKIVAQSQEIEKLKMDKEKLLNEHYLPMQRRLEVEIETISDRVLRMEKNILSMQERAGGLPGQVQNVEKLQISTIKAHAEMKKAHDEASALVEEATRLLSEEREKMSMMVEQSRQELAEHRAKSEELEGAIGKIARMEEEAANLVITARGALAEQAERLATAEKNASELTALKDEIAEGVSTAKREMASAKGVLSGLEKQMTQMRQIEIWAESIRQEYGKKMVEVDDYIRNGNEEFETLRESVEANFVRRYLKELRQLTDSYTFELGQVKNAEGNIDQRISEEKKKLDDLLEEGRKISYLYEMQSREIEGGEKFGQHAESFRTLSEIAAQRTQLEHMIAQVVGNRAEHQAREMAAAGKGHGMTGAKRKPAAKSAKGGTASANAGRKAAKGSAKAAKAGRKTPAARKSAKQSSKPGKAKRGRR